MMGRAAGFTLIEMLVVITTIGLVLLAAPRLGGLWMEGARERAAVKELEEALARALYWAIASQISVRIVFDIRNRAWRTQPSGLWGHLPDDGIHVLGIDNAAPGQTTTTAIELYPDGGSSGGTIIVDVSSAQQDWSRIAADWLSGRIEVHD
jgi:general secretion pathway protein H